MALAGLDAFSVDYTAARARFVDAARAAGAVLASFPMPARGPQGDVLSVDEARLGPYDARAVVVLSSGLHGVEGFPGSAIQLAWLERRTATTLPDGVSIVLVHALNPYGFAWLRRTDEHNVDLNRNFLDGDASSVGANDETRRIYDRLGSFLNRASPPSRWDDYLFTLEAAGLVLRHGLAPLRRTLPVGQYHQPTGLFYGGERPAPATELVRARLPGWVGDATRIVHLDVHSGLGRWADCQLLVPDVRGSVPAVWAAGHFGGRVRPADERRAYLARGTMTEDLRGRVEPRAYHGITVEFGTYSSVRALGALRAENQAHFHSSPDDAVYRHAKRRLAEVFAPRSRRWRAEVVRTGVEVVDRAVRAAYAG